MPEADIYQKIAQMPDTDALEVLSKLGDEERNALRRTTMVLQARYFNEQGFAAFFEIMHGTPLHRTAREVWVPELFRGWREHKGVMLKCHREGAKSTVLKFFLAFAIGHMPERVHGIARINDSKGNSVSKAIADIIDTDPKWKWVFPWVTPNKASAWGAEGYDVQSSRMDGKDITEQEWAEWITRRPDGNTFVGMGYKSGSWIGSRFNGVFLFDDILDERNTESSRQLAEVERVVTNTIEYCLTEECTVAWAYTPWLTNDIYAKKEASGEYIKISTPVMTPASEGDEGATFWPVTPLNQDEPNLGSIKYSGQWWVLHWPEQWDFDRLASVYRRSAGLHGSFERMMMLDLKALQGTVLKREWLHEYPGNEIKQSWQVFFGVDYASTSDKKTQGHRDYFTIAVMRAIPGGGLVLVDGTREQFSKGEALDRLVSLAGQYSPSIITVESIGKGEEFYNDAVMINDAYGRAMPLIPVKSHGKSKGKRFEEYLAPRFKMGRIKITDTPTPFINAFISEWVGFPSAPHDDTIDSVYMCVIGAEGNLHSNNRNQNDSGRGRGTSKHPLTRMQENFNAN